MLKRLHPAARVLTCIHQESTYRQWLGWFVNAFRGPGKNYMMSLGMTMTFTEEKDEYGEQIRNMLDAGENPPHGVIVYYTLPERYHQNLPWKSITLTFLDADGNEIKAFQPKAPETAAKDGEPKKEIGSETLYLYGAGAKTGLFGTCAIQMR